MREEQNTPDSEYRNLIAEYIKNGQIVPVEITCSLLEKAMRKNMLASGDGSGRFLIDGFPRNPDNLDGWQRMMADKVDFLFVLHFDLAEEVCRERCLNRGKAGSGRDDDNEESLRKRMASFVRDTWPIIQHFEAEGKVRTVNGAQEPELVFQEVKNIFSQFK